MTTSYNIKRLTLRQRIVLAAMIEHLVDYAGKWSAAGGPVIGGGVRDLKKHLTCDETWPHSAIIETSESLVKRGIFLRQHGDAYMDGNYPGEDDGDVWYAINREIAEDEEQFKRLFLSLRDCISPESADEMMVKGTRLIIQSLSEF